MEKKITEINEREVILRPVGNINFSNSKKLKEILENLFEKSYKKVVVDFSEITEIDSSALGKLLLFHKRLRERDGGLIITNIENDYIKDMFEMIHFHKLIEIKEEI